MKITKRILILLVMFLGLCIPGELYQSYLDVCENFTSADYSLPEGEAPEAMLNTLHEEAERQGIHIFKMRFEIESAFKTVIQIYADPKSRAVLEDDYELYNGQYGSLLSGSTSVCYHDFFDLTEADINNDAQFEMIGDINAVLRFHEQVEAEYGGELPQENGYNAKADSNSIILVIWVLMIVLSCMMTYYEIMMLKKEHFIRMTMGERLWKICLRFMASDLLYYVVVFVGVRLVVQLFYGVQYRGDMVLLLFGIFLVCNLLVSLCILFINPSKALSNDFLSRKLLTANYAIKCGTIVLTSLVMSMAISEVYECLRYYRQKPIYESYADYYVLTRFRDHGTNADNDLFPGKLYAECVDSHDIIYDYNCLSYGEDDRETAIVMNRNALPLLQREIPELAKVQWEPKVYIIMKEGTVLPEADIRAMGQGEAEIVTYRKDASVFAFPSHEEDHFTIRVDNPVIVFYCRDFADFLDEEMLAFNVNFSKCFMKLDDRVAELAAQEKVYYTATNMMEIFDNHWTRLSRTCYLNLMVCILLLIIQIIVLSSIVRLEYAANAVELSLKKILGYGIMQKFRKKIIVMAVLYAVCMTAACILSAVLHFGTPTAVLLAVACGLLMDMTVFWVMVKRYERSNVPKILKGGAL